MSFVYDGSPLPTGKSDSPKPPTAPVHQRVGAAEWNTAMQAALDLRSSLLSGANGGPFHSAVPGVPITVNVLDFGAVGDNASDCLAAFQAAVAFLASVGGGEVYVPPGRYYLSGTLTLSGPWVHLRGTGRIITGLRWPAGVTGIKVEAGSIVPLGGSSGMFTRITDLTLFTTNPPTVRGTARGIWSTTQVWIERVEVYHFDGHGVEINGNGFGSPPTNANGWRVQDLRIINCGHHGFYPHGGDASAGYSIGVWVYTHEIGGAGIFDGSMFGGVHVAAFLEGNSLEAPIQTNNQITAATFVGPYVECMSAADAGVDACILGGAYNVVPHGRAFGFAAGAMRPFKALSCYAGPTIQTVAPGGLVRSGHVVTITLPSGHGYQAGDRIGTYPAIANFRSATWEVVTATETTVTFEDPFPDAVSTAETGVFPEPVRLVEIGGDHSNRNLLMFRTGRTSAGVQFRAGAYWDTDEFSAYGARQWVVAQSLDRLGTYGKAGLGIAGNNWAAVPTGHAPYEPRGVPGGQVWMPSVLLGDSEGNDAGYGRRVDTGSAEPTTGTWHLGDYRLDAKPTTRRLGWRCIRSGTFGTYTEGRTGTSDGTLSGPGGATCLLTLSGASDVLHVGTVLWVNGTKVTVWDVPSDQPSELWVYPAVPAGSGLSIAYYPPAFEVLYLAPTERAAITQTDTAIAIPAGAGERITIELSSAADITFSATPLIAARPAGSEITLVNAGTHTLTLTDDGTLAGSKVILASGTTLALAPGGMVRLLAAVDGTHNEILRFA